MYTLTPDLLKVFELSNLKKAWTRVNTAEQVDYKNYFRHLYHAYNLSIEENLKDLRLRLKNFKYESSFSTKIYLPKKNGLQRTFTLLTTEDQIVYQAFCNIIASKLYSKSSAYYNQYNFSYHFAGEKSPFFYKRWKDGYNRFKKEFKNEFKSGKIYTATFDYTSFYDTIDHNVLVNLLEELGFTNEFCQIFINLLKTWTCTDIKDLKYHSHGIPQGPSASGIIGEVLLNFVDRSFGSKPRACRYLRYADDIRILSEQEVNVKKAIVNLDLISKKIGIFPQANKTKINKIENVSTELKEISTFGDADFSIFIKKDLTKKISKIIKQGIVLNETQFKYYLNRTKPSSLLDAKCIAILYKQPHLYETILYYLSQRRIWTRKMSYLFFEFLKSDILYEEIIARCLETAFSLAHPSMRKDYLDYCIDYIPYINEFTSSNLKAQIFAWLLAAGVMKYSDLKKAITENEDWVVHNIIDKIDINQYGKPSYDLIINELLSSKSIDVSIFSSYIAVKDNIDINYLFTINHIAQFPLLKVGKIATAKRRPSTISESLTKILNIRIPDCSWRKFLGAHHDKAERQIFICRSYIRSDATALINQIDVFNDIVLNAIYIHDNSLGSYTMGNIGGNLNSSTCRLAKQYKPIYELGHNIHHLRKESDLSHPVNKATKNYTRRIAFAEIKKHKPTMLLGYLAIVDFIEKATIAKRGTKKKSSVP